MTVLSWNGDTSLPKHPRTWNGGMQSVPQRTDVLGKDCVGPSFVLVTSVVLDRKGGVALFRCEL